MIDLRTNANLRHGLLAAAILIVVALAIVMGAPELFASGGEEGTRPEITLDGSSWTLISINGEAVLPGSELNATFADGQIAGSAGVNRYFASYETDGDSLTLGPAGSTMMMGPDELMSQEMAFLSALATAASFQVDGSTLEIHFEGGSLLFAASK